MSNILTCILCLSMHFATKAANESQPAFAANELLLKTAENLNKYTHIQYYHERDLFTGDKHYFTRGTNLMDFENPDSILGVKYHISAGDNEYIFNGSESFVIDKKEKTILVNNQPTAAGIEGGSFFYNSLITLRRVLPLIASDKNIAKTMGDTLIANKPYYVVRFLLRQKTLNSFGGYFPITENISFTYNLVIDKISFLPCRLHQVNNNNEQTVTTSFTKYNFNPAYNETLFYYSTYLPQYKLITGETASLTPLAVGIAAPEFSLPLFTSGKIVHSKNYAGKVLLLGFWIRNCGPCIASVPKLNAMLEKYKGSNFEILGINAHDSKPVINYFVEKYKPAYTIAYNGKEITNRYGINGFPYYYILSKKGDIIYSGYFDADEMEKIIDKALQ